MKKFLIGIGLVGVIALAFGAANTAFAQDTQLNSPGAGGYGPHGPGNGGHFGDGLLQDYMTQNLADALGITVEEFISRRDSGETFFQIALELGFDEGEIREMMLTAHEAAVEQALADGVITQEQVKQFQQRKQFTNKEGAPHGVGHHGSYGQGPCWDFDQDGE